MNTPTGSKSVKILKEKFTSSLGLPFQELLPSQVIQEYLAQLNIKYRQRLFDVKSAGQILCPASFTQFVRYGHFCLKY